MKKLVLSIISLLIVSSLFASVDPSPKFNLSAQVNGILFHGFTTSSYSNSDELLAANGSEDWNASVSGLNLASNDSQSIGSYAFYSTSRSQSSVSFETTPLSLEVFDDTYFVPYALTYSSKINNKKISLGDGSIGKALVATTDDPDSETENVLTTKSESTGLRYEILSLAVTFAGDDNVSFGLPESPEGSFYTGSIRALITAN